MILKTERLTIRPIEAGDWNGVKDIWVDFQKSTNSQYDRPHPTEDEAVQAKIASWAENHSRAHMFFAICLADAVIGYTAFHKRADAYELGYCFHSDYHGNGYARESLTALFRYLHTLGIPCFRAGTALKNLPSVALLRSLGFHLVKTELVSFYKDHQGQDLVFDGGIF